MFYVFVLLFLLFLATLTLSWGYHLLPLEELRRRARANARDAQIYKVASRTGPLNLLLWLVGSALGVALIILAARWAWWAGVLVGFIAAWLVVRPPLIRPDGWLWSFTSKLSPAVYKILDELMPLLRPLSKTFARPHPSTAQIYEKSDLVEFINSLKRQPQSRISSADLDIAASALKFSEAKVGSVMAPKKQVRFVGEAEAIGPKIMDELFATGFKLFPVVRGSAKAATPEVVGMLELKVLLKKLESSGKVESIARRDIYYIDEDASLSASLDAIVKHHHQLLIVVNSFEEIVGVVTLEQILNQLVGELPNGEFDDHASRKAVAAQHQPKEAPHDEPLSEHVVKS